MERMLEDALRAQFIYVEEDKNRKIALQIFLDYLVTGLQAVLKRFVVCYSCFTTLSLHSFNFGRRQLLQLQFYEV